VAADRNLPARSSTVATTRSNVPSADHLVDDLPVIPPPATNHA
jgi:hypothetical protein